MTIKKVACSAVHNCGAWAEYITAAIYNVVDEIILVDSSPYGNSEDNILEKLEKFPKGIEIIDWHNKSIEWDDMCLKTDKKIIYIKTHWEDYVNSYNKMDNGYRLNQMTAQARPRTLAFDLAGKRGADWILHLDYDQCFFSSLCRIDDIIKNPSKYQSETSFRFHIYDSRHRADLVKSDNPINSQDSYAFLGLFKYYPYIAMEGLEGFISTTSCTPQPYFNQRTIRDIQMLHLGFVHPGSYEDLVQYLYIKKLRTFTMRNRDEKGRNDHWGGRELSQIELEEEAMKAAKSDADTKGDNVGTGNHELIPKEIPLVMQMNPYEYVEKGYPYGLEGTGAYMGGNY